MVGQLYRYTCSCDKRTVRWMTNDATGPLMAIPERFTTCGTTVKFNSSPAGAFRMETWSVHQHEGPAQQTMDDNSHGTMHGTMITLPRRPEQRDCRRSGPPALRLDRACTPGAADQSPHGGENKNPVAAACVNLGHSTRWSTPGVVGRAVVSPAGRRSPAHQ